MSYLICGVGQAGGNIVNEMFHERSLHRIATPVAVNSTLKDLQGLDQIPRSNWLGLSETKGIVLGPTPGFEELVVGGFGKDPRLAYEVTSANMDTIVQFFRGFVAQRTHQKNLASKEWTHKEEGAEWSGVDQNLGSIPFALIVLGMGGGTGCGTAALIAEAIRAASATTTSIVVVGILPATHGTADREAHGAYRQAANTMFALDLLERVADGIILVDNERLTVSSNVEALFPDFNRYIAHALNDLILGNLLEGVRMERTAGSLPVIDIRDLVSAISFGDGRSGRMPGYATLGWAGQTTRGLSGYFVPGTGKRKIDIFSLTKLALRKLCLTDARPEDGQKNLGLVRVPQAFLGDADVFAQISLVEAELGRFTRMHETHFGITVGKRPLVSVNTVMTWRRDGLPRLQQIQELADRYARPAEV